MAATTFQPEDIVLQKEELSYGSILEVLTSGLYPNKYHVLREYVQNAYDAILAYRRVTSNPTAGNIKVNISNPSIFIYDDGIGMDWRKINQYRYVGYSEKKAGEAVGFRGIGKLSGISVANKLIITTSPNGVPERYRLIFDAEAMLSVIIKLKANGQNIPLNDLIGSHTQLTREYEDPQKHYTLIELYRIKGDSKSLENQARVAEYLGMNAPVDFNPSFCYGATIDLWLRKHVIDYDTVAVYLNGNSVYKPFLTDLNPPQKGFVHDMDDDSENAAPPLAFYWYCEHATKGQFEDKDKRGLFYRVKNFAIGNNQLPRITLWATTPERAYYFWGEIHICDPLVTPTSDRGDFEQNLARERLYKHCGQVSRTLNALAGESSAKRRSKEFIEQAEILVHAVEDEAAQGMIPQEVRFDKAFSVREKISDVSKRLKDAPEDYQQRGDEIIAAGKTLVQKLEKGNDESGGFSAVYDIKDKLKLGKEAAALYDAIVQALKEELYDQPILYERVIKRIHLAISAEQN